jgi:F-type H+-transporting ATPase subunit O
MLPIASALRSNARRAVGVRAFVAPSLDAAHRPPIDLYGLHARYANAVYTAASKVNALEKVEGELLALKETAAKSKYFSHFLVNPLISRDAKEKNVISLLKGKTTPTTLNLMTTLAGNARLSELPKIVSTFQELMKAKRGEVEAVIISAEPLSKSQAEAVSTAMKTQVAKGKKVIISTKVDPSIGGGLQVQIGDQFLDLSVTSRIDEIGRITV